MAESLPTFEKTKDGRIWMKFGDGSGLIFDPIDVRDIHDLVGRDHPHFEKIRLIIAQVKAAGKPLAALVDSKETAVQNFLANYQFVPAKLEVKA